MATRTRRWPRGTPRSRGAARPRCGRRPIAARPRCRRGQAGPAVVVEVARGRSASSVTAWSGGRDPLARVGLVGRHLGAVGQGDDHRPVGPVGVAGGQAHEPAELPRPGSPRARGRAPPRCGRPRCPADRGRPARPARRSSTSPDTARSVRDARHCLVHRRRSITWPTVRPASSSSPSSSTSTTPRSTSSSGRGLRARRGHAGSATTVARSGGSSCGRRAWTGLLLERADGDRQRAVVGEQAAGRVGFFLRVDDFDARRERLQSAGVRFLTRRGRAVRPISRCPRHRRQPLGRSARHPRERPQPSRAAGSPRDVRSRGRAGPDLRAVEAKGRRWPRGVAGDAVGDAGSEEFEVGGAVRACAGWGGSGWGVGVRGLGCGGRSGRGRCRVGWAAS